MTVRNVRPQRLVLIAFGLLLNGCGGRLSHPGASGASAGDENGGAGWTGGTAGWSEQHQGPGGASGAVGSGGASGSPEAVSAGSSVAGSGFGGGGTPDTVFYGPDGTTITSSLAAGALTVETSCDDIPAGLFEPQFGPCLRVSTSVELLGKARVCFPNPNPNLNPKQRYRTWILRCTAPLSGVIKCADPDRLFNGKCCSELELIPGAAAGADPVCEDTDRFNTFAAGILTDSDDDFVADFDDNCRFEQNSQQFDTDHDQIGNACDNCPTVDNADQADTNHDGIGDVCEAASGAAEAGGAAGTP